MFLFDFCTVFLSLFSAMNFKDYFSNKHLVFISMILNIFMTARHKCEILLCFQRVNFLNIDIADSMLISTLILHSKSLKLSPLPFQYQ
jgi:hypothetical protein